jgi:hypothetical protein
MAKFDWNTKALQADLDLAQTAFEDYLQVETTADKSARHMFYWGYLFGRGLIKGVTENGESEVGEKATEGVESGGDKGEASD